jgi:hypothetical protein
MVPRIITNKPNFEYYNFVKKCARLTRLGTKVGDGSELAWVYMVNFLRKEDNLSYNEKE